jgi:hypothetical protein
MPQLECICSCRVPTLSSPALRGGLQSRGKISEEARSGGGAVSVSAPRSFLQAKRPRSIPSRSPPPPPPGSIVWTGRWSCPCLFSLDRTPVLHLRICSFVVAGSPRDSDSFPRFALDPSVTWGFTSAGSLFAVPRLLGRRRVGSSECRVGIQAGLCGSACF